MPRDTWFSHSVGKIRQAKIARQIKQTILSKEMAGSSGTTSILCEAESIVGVG
jgi:hypothetical protein